MAYIEEVFLPKVYAVLKDVSPLLADELAVLIGLPTRAQEEQAAAEAAHSAEMAAQTAPAVEVVVPEAGASGSRRPR